MSDLNIHTQKEFIDAWKQAAADGTITQAEIKKLKEVAAKTQEGKSVPPNQSDDFVVGELEKKAKGTTELQFVDEQGTTVKAKVDFKSGQVIIDPKDVTPQNVDVFLSQKQSANSFTNAEKALKAQLSNGSDADKLAVIKALAKFADPRVLLKVPDHDPKLVKTALVSVYQDPKASPALRAEAAGALADNDLGDQQLYEKMRKESDSGIRAAGIRGLGWAGTKETIALLEKIYKGAAGQSDRVAVERALNTIRLGNGPNKGLAQAKYQELLGESQQASSKVTKASLSGIGQDSEMHAKVVDLRKRVEALLKADDEAGAAKALKAFKAQYGEAFLKIGRGSEKGYLVDMLMNLPKSEQTWTRQWAFDLLMSTKTSNEHNDLLDGMRGISKTGPNLKAFLGPSAYAKAQSHYTVLVHEKQGLLDRTASTLYHTKHERDFTAAATQVLVSKEDGLDEKGAAKVYKGKVPETADRIFEWVQAAETNMVSVKEAQSAVRVLLESLGSKADYDALLKQLQKTRPTQDGRTWEDRIDRTLASAASKKAIFDHYDHPKAEKAPPQPGKAAKWTGPPPAEWATQGAFIPDHHDTDNERFLESFVTHHKPHNHDGTHAALEVGEVAAEHILEHAGEHLAHHGFEVAGTVLQGLGTAVSVYGWVKVGYTMLKGYTDDVGPGMWRMAAKNAYADSYASTYQKVADLWKSSGDMDVFMAKLNSVVPKTGDQELSDELSTYKSIGKIAGTRDALIQILSLLDPKQGGSPEKLASYLDALARNEGGKTDVKGNVYAAVHRKNE